MNQAGLFDWHERYEQLAEGGDPLVKLNRIIDWRLFHADLKKLREKKRHSKAGRKPFDAVLMFKILILQSLYNLSDDQTEYQIRDRLSFMRFLGLSLHERVPDAKTIWLFREQLTEARLIDKLFARFDAFLRQNGFAARKGQIVDASLVRAPRQRNSRTENQQIMDGRIPPDWSEPKKRQKDTDARWVRKNGQNHFGYKNHIQVDVKYKLIRKYAVTDAATHDSRVFEKLLDDRNSSKDVWADSAYRSAEKLEYLRRNGRQSHAFEDA